MCIRDRFSVAGQEPPSEGNAVSLIIELLRVDLVKRMQFRFFQDLGMDGRNPVYGKSVVNVHVRHVYAIVFINDPDLRVAVFGLYPRIQFLNDRNELRHHFFQIGQRPLFQRLCQNRMIAVSYTHLDVYKRQYQNYTIELDVFLDALAPLVFAEVEFPTEQEALAFVPPAWFGKDVTMLSLIHI